MLETSVTIECKLQTMHRVSQSNKFCQISEDNVIVQFKSIQVSLYTYLFEANKANQSFLILRPIEKAQVLHDFGHGDDSASTGLGSICLKSLHNNRQNVEKPSCASILALYHRYKIICTRQTEMCGYVPHLVISWLAFLASLPHLSLTFQGHCEWFQGKS